MYWRFYSSIKMMVGSAFLGLNIVAVGIVRNVSIIMLAKLLNYYYLNALGNTRAA